MFCYEAVVVILVNVEDELIPIDAGKHSLGYAIDPVHCNLPLDGPVIDVVDEWVSDCDDSCLSHAPLVDLIDTSRVQ